MLQPNDAVRLAEKSELFKLHYSKGGCPSASAGLGPRGDIQLRISDGCLSAVSVGAGDFIVDRTTGEVRDIGGTVIIKRTDPIVLSLWAEIESGLLSNNEAACIVMQADKVQDWRRKGVPIAVKVRPVQSEQKSSSLILVDVIPKIYNPSSSYNVLRFSVDQRQYRLFEGRFSREDFSQDVVLLIKLFELSKRPLELAERDLLEDVRKISEVKEWLGSGACRGVRLESDQEGQTYYSVDLFKWCVGEPNSESLAGFAVEKRSGEFFAPQGIALTTKFLSTVQARLKAQAELRSVEKEKLKAKCSNP